jgi:hypothetical protein
MLTYLRNVFPGLSRQLGSRTQSAAAALLPQYTSSTENKILVTTSSARWEEIAERLENDLKKYELGKILDSVPDIKHSLESTKPENCSPDEVKAISNICTVIGRAKRYVAARDESKSWFQRALDLNQNNNEANKGMDSILVAEGDPSKDVTFYAPISSKLK